MVKSVPTLAVLAFVLSVVIAFHTTPAMSQEWVSFDGVTSTATEPDFEVRESDVSGVSFDVAVYGMSVKDTVYQGVTYQRLNIPEYLWSAQVGAPEVPVVRALVAIPDCEDIVLEVTTADSVTHENFRVYPVPELVDSDSPDGFLRENFVIDFSVYNTNALYPGVKAEIVTTGYIRDQRIVQVALYPVQFNPKNGQLRAYSGFKVNLSFDSPSGTLLKNVGPFDNICKANIINYR